MKNNSLLATRRYPFLLIRCVVGLIFISEGVQKLLYPGTLGEGRFAQIGFGHPTLWANFTAAWEIACGLLILPGLLTRIASIPLLIIMGVAFVTTKYPILVQKGFWAMAHEYRTDFALTLLLLVLLWYGAGNRSLDIRLHEKR